MSIKHLLKQRVKVKILIVRGGGFYGDDPPPQYDTSVVPARVVKKNRLVRNAAGSEVVSDTQVWLEDEPAGPYGAGEIFLDPEAETSESGAEAGLTPEALETMVGMSGRVEGCKAFL